MVTKLIISIYRLIQASKNNLFRIISKKQFKSNCITGANFECSEDAKCINNSISKGNIVIGDNCELNCSIITGKKGVIKIGNNTTVRFSSKIFSISNIFIGNDVIISNNVTITDNNNHPTDPVKRLEMSRSGYYSDLWQAEHSDSKPIYINDNVWIGEKSTILKGVTIGEGSIIATSSVVTKDVPPYTIVAGNPAKVVKYLRD